MPQWHGHLGEGDGEVADPVGAGRQTEPVVVPVALEGLQGGAPVAGGGGPQGERVAVADHQ